MLAPLDWGLGHATRCIPLIIHLIEHGCQITIAAEKATKRLLEKEFPTLEFIELPGYHISYPKKGRSFIVKILLQIPKILRAIHQENKWLKHQLKKRSWDIVISDNRYGLYNEKVTSIFITHQLRVISGAGKMIDGFIQQFLYKKINLFTQCWIPDIEGDENIAGVLSHPEKKPDKFTYIGLLSRLNKKNESSNGPILVMLSGPEPQRTILENVLIKQTEILPASFLFVRGLPEASEQLSNRKNIVFKDFMDLQELSKAMSDAPLVICRAGYSSIMDLLKLNKRAILIPTPGQSEQLYLANRMKALKLFAVQYQDEIAIDSEIEHCLKIPEYNNSLNFDGFKKAIKDLGI